MDAGTACTIPLLRLTNLGELEFVQLPVELTDGAPFRSIPGWVCTVEYLISQRCHTISANCSGIDSTRVERSTDPRCTGLRTKCADSSPMGTCTVR